MMQISTRRLAIATLVITALSLAAALVTFVLVRGDWGPPAPGVVLATSAERFDHEVQSLKGKFEADVNFDDFEVRMKGDFAFRAPDSLYMTIGIFGETIDYLMVEEDVYIRVPGQGWYVIAAEESGIDRAALERYLENRGAADYAGIAGQLQDLERLPDATIEDVSYLRYRGTLNYADLMEELPEGLIDPAVSEQAQEFLGPAEVEVWLERETFLPRQVDLQMTFDVEDYSFSIDMSMEFTDYNGPVDIPEPPVEARPFAELLEEESAELEEPSPYYPTEPDPCFRYRSEGGWGESRLIEEQWVDTSRYGKPVTAVEVPAPKRTRGETLSWQLWLGSELMVSEEARNTWGEDWFIEFEYSEETVPGRYKLRVYVDCQLASSTSADLP